MRWVGGEETDYNAGAYQKSLSYNVSQLANGRGEQRAKECRGEAL